MPVSEKQLEANRRNAQKSTGPKTKRGKKIVSQNGVKHGLFAHDLVITSSALKEDRNDYDILVASIFDELKPVGLFQECLAHKIVDCLWRSRRAVRAETAQLNHQLDDVDDTIERNARLRKLYSQDDSDDPEADNCERATLTGIRSLPDQRSAVNILRYELRLDRQLTRTYNLFIRLQKNSDHPRDSSDPAPAGDSGKAAPAAPLPGSPKNDKTNPFPPPPEPAQVDDK